MFIFAASLLLSTAYSQTAASVTWNLILPDSLNVSSIVGNLTGLPAAGTDSFKVVSYSGTTGGGPGPLGSNFCRWNPGTGLSWGPETGENAYHYVQFICAPKTGATFSVDSVSIYTSGGGTGTMRALAYYSKDATFASKTRLTPIGGANGDTLVLPNSSSNYVYFSFAVKTTIASGQSLYVRFSPWYPGAASVSKYFYTQFVVIKGTTTGGTGVEQTGDGLVKEFALQQNYPNPFNPSTQISYNVPKESFVSLKVFNLMGQEVATLVSGNQTAGKYTVPFDASHVSSGIYMYRLQAGSSVEVKRMTFVK